LKLHLRTIRRSTLKIARSFGQLESRLRRLERQAKRTVPGKRRPVRLTRARRAELKLQGKGPHAATDAGAEGEGEGRKGAEGDGGGHSRGEAFASALT
jgi:hypothetical protein